MTTQPAAPAVPMRAAPPNRPSWSGARTALVVIGSLIALLGLGILASGLVTLWVDRQQDDDGYLTSGPGHFASDTYAIAVSTLDVGANGPDFLYRGDRLGEIRLRLEPPGSGPPLFVGIGPAADVANYLRQVNHDEVLDFDVAPFSVSYDRHAGGTPASEPAKQTFWAASDSGTGPRTLTWPVATGDWAIVIMNADASAGVEADVTVGSTLPVLGTIAVVALSVGGFLTIVGILLVVLPITTRRRGSARPSDPPRPSTIAADHTTASADSAPPSPTRGAPQ